MTHKAKTLDQLAAGEGQSTQHQKGTSNMWSFGFLVNGFLGIGGVGR
jgi:hypothetical protein